MLISNFIIINEFFFSHVIKHYSHQLIGMHQAICVSHAIVHAKNVLDR